MKTPLNMTANIVEIYYIIDEFCKKNDTVTEEYRIPSKTAKKTHKRAYSLVIVFSIFDKKIAWKQPV